MDPVYKKGLKHGILAAALGIGMSLVGFHQLSTRYSAQLSGAYNAVADFFSSKSDNVEASKKEINIKDLSLEEIASQLIFTSTDGLSDPQLSAGFGYIKGNDATAFSLSNGGIVHTEKNLDTRIEEARENYSGVIPPFIGDEGEGGWVRRVNLGLPPAELLGQYLQGEMREDQETLLNTKYPSLLTKDGELSAQRNIRKQNIETLFRNAAASLRNHKIDFVFAPVLDIVADPSGKTNALDGSDRSYGTDPKVVEELAALYLDALHGQGIKAIGKHWVGAGIVENCDPHQRICEIEEAQEALYNRAQHPFDALGKDLDGIMVTHLVEPNADMPSSLDPKTYEKIRSLTNGIIITDDLEMKGIAQWYKGEGDRFVVAAALDALYAGADGVIIKGSDNALQVKQEIMRQMHNDPAFLHQVEEKLRRLLQFKGLNLEEKVEGESIKQIVQGVSEQGYNWYKVQVKKGDSFLGILASEQSTIAGYTPKGHPMIKTEAEYTKLKSAFEKINSTQAHRIIAGKNYFFPDLNQDGVVSHLKVAEPTPKTIPREPEAEKMKARFRSGQNLYWYFTGEFGAQGVVNAQGDLLPLGKKGRLQQAYADFRSDNRGVTSYRRLYPNQDYVLRDYNGNGKIDFTRPPK